MNKNTIAQLTLVLSVLGAASARAQSVGLDPTFDDGSVVIVKPGTPGTGIPNDPTHGEGGVVVVRPGTQAPMSIKGSLAKAERMFLGTPGVQFVAVGACRSNGLLSTSGRGTACIVVGVDDSYYAQHLARRYGQPFSLDGVWVNFLATDGFHAQ